MNSCHFQLTSFGITDIGLVRSKNEDVFDILKKHAFFMVADGMGGHRAGEEAAKQAVKAAFNSIKSLFSRSKKNWTISELMELNNRSIQDANKWVHDLGKHRKEYQGMGTTICTILFYERSLVYGHVGDCRIYRLRNGSLQQLTSDHSLKNAMIQQKQMTEEDAKHFAFKNIVTRAIGTRVAVKAEIRSARVIHEDLYLMCSDGLTDRVENDEIEAILTQEKTMKRAAETLIELAKKRGGQDNVTVLLIQANERENLLRQ